MARRRVSTKTAKKRLKKASKGKKLAGKHFQGTRTQKIAEDMRFAEQKTKGTEAIGPRRRRDRRIEEAMYNNRKK
jgi:hypothetical protein